MSDQITFAEIGSPLCEEERFYQQILPVMKRTLAEAGIPKEWLELEQQKSYYSVVLYDGQHDKQLVCRIKNSKMNGILLSFRCWHGERAQLLDGIPNKSTKSDRDSGFVRIAVADASTPECLERIAATLISSSIEAFAKDFDCCSRYTECSDARHCIHPDVTFSMGCGYRRVLYSGKVFYGANRNVD